MARRVGTGEPTFMVSLITCLALGLGRVKDKLSWGCRPDAYMRPLQPGSLGVIRILTRWFRAQSTSVPVNQEEIAWLSVTWPQRSPSVTSSVLYWSKQSQADPDSRGGDTDPTPLWEEYPKNCSHFVKLSQLPST